MNTEKTQDHGHDKLNKHHVFGKGKHVKSSL